MVRKLRAEIDCCFSNDNNEIKCDPMNQSKCDYFGVVPSCRDPVNWHRSILQIQGWVTVKDCTVAIFAKTGRGFDVQNMLRIEGPTVHLQSYI